MENKKAGILLHISSLPSKYGIGTLGKEAYNFIDFLHQSKISIWQILPLNVISFGNSPYQSPSSIGLNPYFIDLDILKDDGLLKEEDYINIDWGCDLKHVDFSKIWENRYNVLKLAYKNFDKKNQEYLSFIFRGDYHDFALYMALKEVNDFKEWKKWDIKYQEYNKKILYEFYLENKDLVDFYEWSQFIFLKQYFALKKYSNDHDVKIMGDMPIYVAYDSVDVYKYPEYFQLDENKDPIAVAGCPPDFFNSNGQLWGNPLYDWDKMEEDNFKWWNNRISYNLKLFDLLRIDHFRGFSGYYSVPFKDKTAINGCWKRAPGVKLYQDKINLPIVAEDLGLLDNEFYSFMEKTKYPGMKIAIQGFDNDPNSIWKPYNYSRNYYAYTSTHDSTTTKQFIDELNEDSYKLMLKELREECNRFQTLYISNENDKKEITYKIIELTLLSNAKAAIIPIQDFLALGKESRMNYPSLVNNVNWTFRITKEDINSNLVKLIKDLVVKTKRI